ncbi:uncharacterized protein LOC111270459 [Varroa jacobsoni]|uniref:uncharacterized protein LOC111270459 n=1 Tax=Varroa jacobsoni TaxID=62625 RepID=UPI000BF8AFF4|nr:uncharacterized protein LOC111270459 [Varroa jacobsoni]
MNYSTMGTFHSMFMFCIAAYTSKIHHSQDCSSMLYLIKSLLSISRATFSRTLSAPRSSCTCYSTEQTLLRSPTQSNSPNFDNQVFSLKGCVGRYQWWASPTLKCHKASHTFDGNISPAPLGPPTSLSSDTAPAATASHHRTKTFVHFIFRTRASTRIFIGCRNWRVQREPREQDNEYTRRRAG